MTTYFVVSWTDPTRRENAPSPTTREYGSTTSKQAAIRLAQRVLPPDTEYLVTTLRRTVHWGTTASRRRSARVGDVWRRRR